MSVGLLCAAVLPLKLVYSQTAAKVNIEVTLDFSSNQVFSNGKLISNNSVNLCCKECLDPTSYNNIAHIIYITKSIHPFKMQKLHANGEIYKY